jgi:hypothetical protein
MEGGHPLRAFVWVVLGWTARHTLLAPEAPIYEVNLGHELEEEECKPCPDAPSPEPFSSSEPCPLAEPAPECKLDSFADCWYQTAYAGGVVSGWLLVAALVGCLGCCDRFRAKKRRGRVIHQ